MMSVFQGNDEQQHPLIFRQMYEQRYDIYIKRRKWSGLKPIDNLEKDQYDNDDATYLLALDEEDAVLAGLRLLPTTGPHLFSDMFPQLAGTHGVPRGEHIMELTRYYVAPVAARKQLRWWLMGVIGIGMFEYCLENGIRQVSSVIDTFLLPPMLEAGWRVRPLGLPQSYGQGMAIGILIDITEEAIESTREVRGVYGPVLRAEQRGQIPRIPIHIKRPDVPADGFFN